MGENWWWIAICGFLIRIAIHRHEHGRSVVTAILLRTHMWRRLLPHPRNGALGNTHKPNGDQSHELWCHISPPLIQATLMGQAQPFFKDLYVYIVCVYTLYTIAHF